MTGVKELAESETPPVLNLNEGRSIILTPGRFGGAIDFTETDYVKTGDNTTKIDEYLTRKRNALLIDLKYKMINDMFYMYNNAFSSSALTLAPDGVELCGAHLKADGTAWFTNYDTQAMDSGAIDSLDAYGGAFVDATGKSMPIDFNTIIVKKGGAAAREAKKLFAFNIQPVTVATVNIYYGAKTIIETPLITNTNYWYAYDSNMPIDMPLYFGIVKMPTLHEPMKEKNQSVNIACTGYWKRGINNSPINFFGSIGTT
jgi:hypothetical protein